MDLPATLSGVPPIGQRGRAAPVRSGAIPQPRPVAGRAPRRLRAAAVAAAGITPRAGCHAGEAPDPACAARWRDGGRPGATPIARARPRADTPPGGAPGKPVPIPPESDP